MGIGAARAGFGCGGLSGARARIVRQEKKKGRNGQTEERNAAQPLLPW